MSKAYYYCKNFTFKEVNNLFAYATKTPEHLTQHQRVVRLYKGMLRKLLAQHVYTIRRTDFDRFHAEQYRVRRDFDKILAADADPKEVELMLEKYELYIEKHFEPYAAMHESRMHSNLWGKMVLWGDKALETDHFGYYKPVLAMGEPKTADFTEQYPHMVGAWIYDHQYLNAEFNYEDLESEYLNRQGSISHAEAKQALDNQH